jgi:hypothetical protein
MHSHLGVCMQGTIDALLCSKSATENIRRMCSEICRSVMAGAEQSTEGFAGGTEQHNHLCQTTHMGNEMHGGWEGQKGSKGSKQCKPLVAGPGVDSWDRGKI